MVDRVSSVRFVGREAELTLVRRLLRSARSSPGVVLVRGEAGVGKTRLLEELTRTAAEEGAMVLEGGCLDLAEVPLPFGPIVEALRGFVRRVGPDEAVALLGPSSPELARLLPGAGLEDDAPDEPVGETARARLFETALDVLERLTASRPVCLVIEDLQWADRSTRDLLAFLVPSLPPGVLVVTTYRNDELPSGHWLRQFVAQLDRHPRVTTIDLRPFDRGEVFDQLADIWGDRPPADLVRLVWARSEGNAFFTEELAAVARLGDLQSVPPTTRELLLGRLQALSNDAQLVVGVVAAGGRVVPHRLVAAVAAAGGIDDRALGAALREAVHHQILVAESEQGAYAFRHALLHETAYAELLPGERIDLHAHYGSVLDAHPELLAPSPSVLAEVARHWFLADDPSRALAAAVDAAVAAEEMCGFDEAHQHLERALALWGRVQPPALDRHALLEWAARVADLAGDHRRACALIQQAIDDTAVDDVTRQALLHERLGRSLWAAGEGEEALAAYAHATLLVPAGTTAERSRVLAASARGLMLAGRYREARSLADEAATIARNAGASTEEGDALGTFGFAAAVLGAIDEGLAMLGEASRLAELGGDPNDVAQAYLLRARLLSGPLCRLDEALAVATDGLARLRELGLERDHGVSMQALAADTLFRLGRWDEAAVLLASALEHDPAGVAAIDLYLARGKLSVGRGEFSAARDDLEMATMLAARASNPHFRVPRCTLQAGLALWEQRVDDARAAVDEGLEHLSGADEIWLLAALAWHGLRAEAEAAALARAPEAVERIRERCDALLARAEALKVAGAAKTTFANQLLTYAAMCDAEAARVDGIDAAERWADVTVRWDGLGQPYPAAYARWKHAEALLAGGRRPPQAATLLNEAFEVVAALGAKPFQLALEQLAARARIELGGAPSRPHAATRGIVLTAREEQVLDLVVTGATNREIAGALFISEKTVSVHVSNILAKLGVRSRVEAVTVARQLGLTPGTRIEV